MLTELQLGGGRCREVRGTYRYRPLRKVLTMLSDLKILLAGQRWLIAVLVVSNLVSATFLFIQPILVGRLVGNYTNLGDLNSAVLLALVGFFVGSACISALIDYGSEILSQKFTQNCQLSAGRRIFSLTSNELANYTNGELTSRIIADIAVARRITSQNTLSLPSSILLVISAITACIVLDPILSLVTFCALILLLIVSIFSGKVTARLTTEIQEHYSGLGQGIQRFTSNAVFVMTNNLESASMRDYKESVDSLFVSSRKLARISAIISPISSLLGQILLVVIVVLGGLRIQSGALTYEALATIVTFLLIVIQPIGGIITGITSFAAARSALTRLSPLLCTNPASVSEGLCQIPINEAVPLSFHGVSVKYAEGLPVVIDNLSFSFPTIGLSSITGKSGAGKTTLALLASGVLMPTSGYVAFGKHRITDFDLSFVRSNLITVVLQHAPLYGRTVRDSLALDQEISDAELKKWIKMFGLEMFYSSLPNGLNSRLSDVILEASAGEIQRLSIIRGFLRNTPTIILDEPTANLDPINERLVASAISELANSRSVIVISHRSEPIKNAVVHLSL